MIQNIIILFIIVGAIAYSIYAILKSMKSKKDESPCGGCNGCEIKNELTKNHPRSNTHTCSGPQ